MWPRPALEQVGQPEVDGVQGAVPVDLAHLQRLVQRLVAERAVVGDAGVGDEQLEAAGALGEARRSAACVEAASATSHSRTWWSPGSSAASVVSSSVDRAASPRIAPRAASAVASARPMPREAPVISARVPGVSCMRAEPITMVDMTTDQATVAEEEYLQTLFWLQEAGLPMTGANVARAMQLSPPTVHEMIGRLERDGYITRGARQVDLLHRHGRRARRGRRPPPPADRALPHRRARHPVGRGPRGGRAPRARDVARARGAHARRDRRRQDLPARPPDRRRHAHRGRAAGRRRRTAPRSRSCASRTRPRTCCTTSRTRASSPGLEGDACSGDDGDEVVLDAGGGREVRVTAHGRRDRLGGRRPVAAAARRAARAARARARPLRALTPSSARPKRRSWSPAALADAVVDLIRDEALAGRVMLLPRGEQPRLLDAV